MNFQQVPLLAVLLVVQVCSSTASAGVQTFSMRSEFDSAFASSTLIDFEAQNSGSHTYYVNLLNVGDVTFKQPNNRLFVFSEDFYPTNGLTSNYLNQNCCAPAGITIDFANPVYGIAMELGVQNNWSGAANPNDMVFTLSTGDVVNTTAPMLYETTNTLQFFGFSSDVAITSIHIANPAEGIAIDDFTFSTQMAASNNAVPEPTSAGIWGAAVLGLSLLRRRRA